MALVTAQTNRSDVLHLIAAPSAIAFSELYAAQTMIRWQLRDAAEQVGGILRQLVENAVTTAGHMDNLTNWRHLQWVSTLVIRLRTDGTTVAIHVEDKGDTPPPERAGALLDCRAGFWFPEHGGRVLWAAYQL